MNKPQIFCFTYAGGTSEFFNVIEDDLESVDLVKLEYAGHGKRHKEEYYPDFNALADDMYREVKDRLYGSYALLGYSMGSITTVEVLKRIISSGLPLPSHVFIAAHEPHTKSELLGFTSDELDDWVKKRTVQFGNVSERLLNNKVFWRTYLPLYRADYSIIGKYEFEKLDLHTSVPATIFYSETDTPIAEMRLWERHFDTCEYHEFSGTHFFILEHHAEMAEIIKSKMESVS